MKKILKITSILLIQALFISTASIGACAGNSYLSPKVQINAGLFQNDFSQAGVNKLKIADAFEVLAYELCNKGVDTDSVTLMFLGIHEADNPGKVLTELMDIADLLDFSQTHTSLTWYLKAIISSVVGSKDIKNFINELNASTKALAYFLKELNKKGIDDVFVQQILENILASPGILEKVRMLNRIVKIIELIGMEEDSSISIIMAASYLDVVMLNKALLGVKNIVKNLPQIEPDKLSIEQKFREFKKQGKLLRRIVAVYDPQTGRGIGSAFVAQETKNHYILFTNSHVAGGHDGLILKTNGDGAQLIGKADVLIKHKNKSPLFDDIAVLILDKRQAAKNGVKLIPIEFSEDVSDGELAVLVSGYNSTVSAGWLILMGNAVFLIGAENIRGDSGAPIIVKKGDEFFVKAINTAAGPKGMIFSQAHKEEIIRLIKEKEVSEEGRFIMALSKYSNVLSGSIDAAASVNKELEELGKVFSSIGTVNMPKENSGFNFRFIQESI
ncbi:MAG: hypothetical protein HY810_00275 [Candidatus Omnitrophica bacterium]|nr:hypothetical protein [Candidatus Omnitrophota bacterium]